jgi:hypothetical protein
MDGCLPFSMTTRTPSFDAVMAHAYKAPLDDAGVPILPADWDDDDERGRAPVISAASLQPL